MARERPDALFVATSPFFIGRRIQLVQLAAFHQLPATYSLREMAESGGLMSYGANIGDTYRQVGAYTGRILKGAKPTDLPVVQVSKFELVINAPTARMLDLVVPPQSEGSNPKNPNGAFIGWAKRFTKGKEPS
jgi:ABC-type uncharacterized transport system substrate-binding protein